MAILRFDAFTFDVEASELRKDGHPVKLQPQPTALLGLLLSRAGGIVSREEIQRTLWPDGTVVDYDQSINFCIRRIREVLGDDTEKPRFVETVPRRGYRFIAPVAREGQRHRRWMTLAAVGGVAVLAAALVRRPVESTEDVSPPTTRPFTSFEGYEEEPAFSPDGRQIAYTAKIGDDSYWHIYVKLVAGGDPLQLTHAEANDYAPAWSPEGSQIAFLRDYRSIPSGALKPSFEILAVPGLVGPRASSGGPLHTAEWRGTRPGLAWYERDGSHQLVDLPPLSSRPERR